MADPQPPAGPEAPGPNRPAFPGGDVAPQTVRGGGTGTPTDTDAVGRPCSGAAPIRDTSGRTVADGMIRAPKVCGPESTVAQARDILRNDHVHAVLITEGADLVSVVERPDLDTRPANLPARLTGRLDGRVIGPDADLEAVRRSMRNTGRRRLAVIDEHGRLLGLLCLKRTGRGFCSDTDVRARADERRTTTTPNTDE